MDTFERAGSIALPPPRVEGCKSLFIASEVRCGSTFLAETLAYELNGSLGYQLWDIAKEHFHNLAAGAAPEEALAIWGALFLDSSGFVSSKIMCKALSLLHRMARQSEAVREAFFGADAYWIVLRRRDRIEQAVSLALARKTGAYHFYGDPDQAPDREESLSLEEMEQALRAVTLSDVFLEAFAQSAPTNNKLAFEYEAFVADPSGHLDRIHQLCGFPKLDPATFVNGSKLRRTGEATKQSASRRFKDWFLENHV